MKRYTDNDEPSNLKMLCVGAGFVGASIATFWGGYEIGTAINDAMNIESTVGRGTLDVLVMGVIAVPSYSTGILGGAIVDALYNRFTRNR
ncbi:MAG: hypothetical protein ABIG93_03835 [archaeon]|nr:hypothetical protein [Nanoarchaeota archaeon]